MEFITTEKCQRKLIRNGYIYVFQKSLADDVSSWECVLRRKGQCKSRVKLIITDDFIAQTNSIGDNLRSIQNKIQHKTKRDGYDGHKSANFRSKFMLYIRSLLINQKYIIIAQKQRSSNDTTDVSDPFESGPYVEEEITKMYYLPRINTLLQSWTYNQWTFYNFSMISYHKQNESKLLYIKFINL